MSAKSLEIRPCLVAEPSKHMQNRQSDPMNDEEIVGFEKDAERIIKRLNKGKKELDVIPIVGMAGQGKTTFARKLYNNDNIVYHFDVRAWCVISQTYNRQQLLQEIFNQVTGSKGKVDKVGELADMLRKRLIGRRYLIVLDDMWDIKAWEDLRLSFPNGETGSRIIVTTRLEEVGKQVKHDTDPYFLRFLTRDESLKLLQKKVFQQEGCPPELQDVSLAVAKRCKGLPLVIILVAGIIKRKKMEESWWHEVKNALLSYLGEAEGYSLSTMQLSYDSLPDSLKPCLLYMGMFPEDARIPVSKLINFWIAEGFVQNIEYEKSMEEAAEDYLMDLISSNVVMVEKRSYNGKVKYCQVHDIVLHFCLEKSREEKFMLKVKGHYSNFQPSDWKGTRLSINLSNELSKIAMLTPKPFDQHLRSLITNYGGETYVEWNPFPQISKLGFLKVLDLSSHKVVPLSSITLHPLIYLKYLAVRTNQFDFHPESHLRHLETLIVLHSKSVVLPPIFWKMEKLRHFEINGVVSNLKNNKQGIFEESPKLENLRILRHVRYPISVGECLDVLLQRCPNLQNLRLTISSYELPKKICTFSPKLESLTRLQLLDLFFEGRRFSITELHFPSNLKKLKLEGPHIVSAVPLIAGLPNLEYLKLQDWGTKSEEWCLKDIEFNKLKLLKLVSLGISRLDDPEESFPKLETLVIRMCHKLEEIPPSFADIETLKQIKLIGRRPQTLEPSAVKLKEDIEEIEGCSRLNLIMDVWISEHHSRQLRLQAQAHRENM
uniref:Late blight resistance protein homolog R1B-16 isoform X2 n=1 Tax=Nicotiana sylvestris TaxID=4096 RepID=A0A1U7VIM3_NICSY|nr:PREDICTED: putative late blight resistance protein homolog R1B-16 isoform X2 [Nicotiana sylvestris]XP_009764759.1 PREDICTED: putative late blight resistance protein homolog R1B-16 isoform X2 [Nicotiana sylvestris]